MGNIISAIVWIILFLLMFTIPRSVEYYPQTIAAAKAACLSDVNNGSIQIETPRSSGRAVDGTATKVQKFVVTCLNKNIVSGTVELK